MTEQTLRKDLLLLHVLTERFNTEELKTLCFELNVDFESLPAQGKAGKSRELVQLFKHQGQLEQLEAKLRKKNLIRDDDYSQERFQELAQSISARLDAPGQEEFKELNQQIDAYLDKLSILHAQMAEWKEVHNLLQDLQKDFARCRTHIYAFRGVQRDPDPQAQNNLLDNIDGDWRKCRGSLRKLEELAGTILIIDEPYDGASQTDHPKWFTQPKQAADRLSKALNDEDLPVLQDGLSDFGSEVDTYLYLADKALLNIADQIRQVPRPGSYVGNDDE